MIEGGLLNLVSHPGAERVRGQGQVKLWLRLLGDFEAQSEGGPLSLPTSRKARGLLALVAVNHPQPIRREAAAALLWSGKGRDHAANSLRQALRDLQQSLRVEGDAPLLVTAGGRLSLAPNQVWVDVHDPSSIKWRLPDDGGVGPLLLCQDLHGLDPAFDAHLERVWKNMVFQQAFTPVSAEAAQQGEAASMSVAMAGGKAEAARAALPLSEDGAGTGWRIAVLPFRSLGAPLEGGLSLGMAEEISAALARFRMPRLIATGSFWDGAGPAVDALARCRAFNLDYVISGTIQVSGPRIRVTVTLLDVSMNFEVIWASRFEGTTDDLFTLQDTIASQTVAQIDPELLQRHQFRGESTRTANAVAHQSVLTAIQGIYRSDRPRFMQARDQLQHAIELDPNYAAAHAWLAYWYILAIAEDWIDDPDDAVSKAGEAAQRAVALDPLDARGVSIAGHVKAYLLHDIEAALTLHRRAVTLNPNLPVAWTLSAWSHIYNGDHRTALNHATMAESLSPTDPHVFVVEHAALTAHFFLRELEVADALAASVLDRRPRHATALRVRTATLGHLGRLEEAAACLEQLKLINSGTSLKGVVRRPPLRQVDLDYYVAGLRKAGMPE